LSVSDVDLFAQDTESIDYSAAAEPLGRLLGLNNVRLSLLHTAAHLISRRVSSSWVALFPLNKSLASVVAPPAILAVAKWGTLQRRVARHHGLDARDVVGLDCSGPSGVRRAGCRTVVKFGKIAVSIFKSNIEATDSKRERPTRDQPASFFLADTLREILLITNVLVCC
jgi:hypothetical protein